MAWKLVKVIGWVDEDVPGAPGTPAHPIAPGGPPPHVEHPIPPTVWPNPPGQGPGNPPGFWGGTPPLYPDIGGPGPQPPTGGGGAPPHPEHPIPPTVWPEPPGSAKPPWAPHPEHPIPPGIWPSPPTGGGGGEPPGFWGGRPPEWVDTTPPGPQPSPPGIWGGRPPEYIDIGGPGPQPPAGSVMPPIYLPPVVWPDPPEGLPSFDPDQIPQHPDLPDLNHGVWYWVDNGGAMERAFIADVVRPGHDLPGYEPKLPPEENQPGDWVVCLVNAQRPAWAWIPTAAPETPDDGDHVEHHGKSGAKA